MRRRAVLSVAVLALLAGCASAASGHGRPVVSGSASDSSGTIPGNPHGSFEARPLVGPGVLIGSLGSGVAVATLGFPLPISESAYDQITSLSVHKLQTALSSVDCARPGIDRPSVRVVCTADVPHTALLLGRPVLTASDIASTRAVAPGHGVVQWTIRITLNSAGRAALAAYTTAHHTDQSQSATVTQCATSTVPCSDFLAFVSRGVAVSVPVNIAAITDGVIDIAGQYTGADATALARQLAS